MTCRKTQSGHWQTPDLKCSARGHISNKGARCQVGWKTYLCLVKDLIKDTPSGSILLINDFMVGVGQLGMAAAYARASQEAKDAGVRVCYWGAENRSIFFEVARANINTTIGELLRTRADSGPGL